MLILELSLFILNKALRCPWLAKNNHSISSIKTLKTVKFSKPFLASSEEGASDSNLFGKPEVGLFETCPGGLDVK